MTPEEINNPIPPPSEDVRKIAEEMITELRLEFVSNRLLMRNGGTIQAIKDKVSAALQAERDVKDQLVDILTETQKQGIAFRDRAEKAEALLAEALKVHEGIVNGCVHPDIAVRAMLVDLAPIRAFLSRVKGGGK